MGRRLLHTGKTHAQRLKSQPDRRGTMGRQLCLSFLLLGAAPAAGSVQGQAEGQAEEQAGGQAEGLAGKQAGGDLERGRRLHEQHCLRCHSPQIYQRPESEIADLETLRQRVSHCELGQELSWFPEEVDEVVVYLNALYYHFDTGEGAAAGREKRTGVQTLDLPGALPAPRE